MTTMRRRSFLQRSTGAIGASIAPGLVVGHDGSGWHPHPHQGSYSPSHNLGGSWIKHSFLPSSSSIYAQMPDCLMVVVHHEPVDLSGFEQFAGVTEHVPFYVASGSRLRDLSAGRIREILRGEVTTWWDVTGEHASVEFCANGYDERWRLAFWRVVAHAHDGGLEGLIDALEHRDQDRFVHAGFEMASAVWGSGYRQTAAMVASRANTLGVGLRPRYAREMGLVPLSIEGSDVRSEEYPIQLPTYFYVRTGVEEARVLAGQAMQGLAEMYRADRAAFVGQ